MIKILNAAVVAIALFAGAAVAEGVERTEAYDLLFREGTLDGLTPAATLVYKRDVSSTLKPELGVHYSGQIALSLDDEDEAGMARLVLRQGERSRTMGRFPSSVGNPMIMVFYESVIRDMAASSGGSPFYIRNRVKEALVQPRDIDTGTAIVNGEEVRTQTVRIHPFEGDPNADKMQGFGALEMSVTMSEDVPGWYVSMIATAGTQAAPVYASTMRFSSVETK